MGIVRDDRRGSRFDEVRQVGRRESLTQRAHGGRRKDDVADLAQPDEENPGDVRM
jgi:hypothetical protein